MHKQADPTSYVIELVSSSEDKESSWLLPYVPRVRSPRVLHPFSFEDKVSCSPGWSQIHCVGKDDRELLICLPPAPEIPHVLGMEPRGFEHTLGKSSDQCASATHRHL